MAAKGNPSRKKTKRKRSNTAKPVKKAKKKGQRSGKKRKKAVSKKSRPKSVKKVESGKKTTAKKKPSRKKKTARSGTKKTQTEKATKKKTQRSRSSDQITEKRSVEKEPGIDEIKSTRKKDAPSRTAKKPSTRHPEISGPTRIKEERVVIVQADENKFHLLDAALAKSGFWFTLEEAYFKSGLTQDKFKILIKPDFNTTELVGSTATDPELVEYLIDQLHCHGYTQTSVVESHNSFDLWLENRDVQILADMIGYKYVTPSGHDYEIIDLAEELVTIAFNSGSILRESKISKKWLDAGFTIIFAKNKTDDEDAFFLCLENLISLLPLRDKDYHYKHRLNHSEVLLELLENIRVDFNIIDAYISNHGNTGARAARPIETHTFIAGQHLLLTDHVAALKMGIDPSVSRPHQNAVNKLGLPKNYKIIGELEPYRNWLNVDSLLLESVRKREQWAGLSQLLTPWLQMVDTESFPFKDPLNQQINNLLSHYVAKVDDFPTVFWSLIAINHIFGFLYRSIDAWQIMYAKDKLLQKEVAMNISVEQYTADDFEEIVNYLEPLEEQTKSLTADSNGLRWTYHDDGSVLFEFSHIIPVDFDDFVNKVEIRKSIQYMNDYIGGLILPVKNDKRGRVTNQLERNLYLPQPNYLVFYNGKDIDVSKLEFMRYDNDLQKMYWKTVKSENGSASYDDGIVSFLRLANGDTKISIFGRQQFTLPLFWQVVNLDNYPTLKDILYTHAYTTFFKTTMANFEAVYEGRDVRVGRPWESHAGEEEYEQANTTPSDQVLSLLTSFQDFVQRNIPDKKSLFTRFFTTYNPQPDYVDENGFSHFKSVPELQNLDSTQEREESELRSIFTSGKSFATDFWKELYSAIQKDSGLMR